MNRSIPYFFTIFLIVLNFSAFAQYNGIYFSGGYNASFVQAEDMGFIIRRYNETRDDCAAGFCLSHNMGKLNFMQGPTFTLGISNHGNAFELQWTGRKQTVTAIGSSNNGPMVRRDVRVKLNSFGFNYGYAIEIGPGFIMPGFGIDVGRDIMATRVDFESNFVGEVNYDQLFKELNVGTTLFVNIGINFTENGAVGLLIRPYYQFRWLSQDLDQVNQVLNPNTWFSDPSGLESNFWNGGIQVGLMFGKRD
jgi:hypothetical protein